MIDRTTTDGTVLPGFIPSLTSLLGVGSFDAGNESERFLPFIQSTDTSTQALAFVAAWRSMQAEGADQNGALPEDTMSASEVCAAGILNGTAIVRAQHRLTQEREDVKFARLEKLD
jgi:hypothetical protein